MSARYWILEGHTPRPVGLMEWSTWFERSEVERNVATDVRGDVRVQTDFVGLALPRPPEANPLSMLFETMVFGGPFHGETKRYATWDEATAGHAVMLSRVGLA